MGGFAAAFRPFERDELALFHFASFLAMVAMAIGKTVARRRATVPKVKRESLYLTAL